jgi:hypothetical protein
MFLKGQNYHQQVKALWHRGFYHSSMKVKKNNGTDGAGRIAGVFVIPVIGLTKSIQKYAPATKGGPIARWC